MSQNNPKLNVSFTLAPSLLDRDDVGLIIEWNCPECGQHVIRRARGVIWSDTRRRTSSMETCMFKEWECDDCLSPEAKRRRLLMRQFSTRR